MLTMHRVRLLLACLACVGRGRRVQLLVEDVHRHLLVNGQQPVLDLEQVWRHHPSGTEVNNSDRSLKGTPNRLRPLLVSDPAAAFNAPRLEVRSPVRKPAHQDFAMLPTAGSSPSLASPILERSGKIPSIVMAQDAGTISSEAAKVVYDNDRQRLGESHPDTVVALGQYAAALAREKEGQQEAKPLMKDALRLAREILGPRHPDTLRILRNYEDVFGKIPLMSIFLKLGLKGYYRNFAAGSGLVAIVLWCLRFVTQRIDAYTHMFGPTGISSTLSAAIAGSFAGVLHTLSGPDHLAALAPLALRAKRRASAFRTGAFWGLAHVVGQLLLGFLLLVVSRISFIRGMCSSWGLADIGEQLATFALGFVLIAIGALGLKEAQDWKDGAEEEHHNDGSFATFITGAVSGMQPDALLFCLPALALPSKQAAVSFLIFFGAGTLAAMGGYTVALRAACSSLGSQAVKRVSLIASMVAITFGVIVVASSIGIPVLQGYV